MTNVKQQVHECVRNQASKQIWIQISIPVWRLVSSQVRDQSLKLDSEQVWRLGRFLTY